ncbi:MAG: hypothetical protein UV79_C0013G0004 [candidate division TM6 bacterium GW2011_GWF2_43_17]|nr:MAG: hypothetical protein UV79_C0013G0004 [candidate division TM6 bacterium GW2011_GWF2_43_17]HAU30464.1 hypothetical protein [Candidatus Dependentiae bacterium]
MKKIVFLTVLLAVQGESVFSMDFFKKRKETLKQEFKLEVKKDIKNKAWSLLLCKSRSPQLCGEKGRISLFFDEAQKSVVEVAGKTAVDAIFIPAAAQLSTTIQASIASCVGGYLVVKGAQRLEKKGENPAHSYALMGIGTSFLIGAYPLLKYINAPSPEIKKD